MKFQQLTAIALCAFDVNMLTEANKIIDVYRTISDPPDIEIEYAKKLIDYRYFALSETVLKFVLAKYPDNDYAKAYLATALISQCKTGWVALLQDIHVNAIDPEVRAYTNIAMQQVAAKFLSFNQP